MLFAVYALCMYALYSFMPVVVKMTSATAVNLSLLTADLFSLFCGLFLFHYKVGGIWRPSQLLSSLMCFSNVMEDRSQIEQPIREIAAE